MKKVKKKEGFKLTRRQFLKGAAAAGVGMALPLKFGVGTAHAFAQSPAIPKFLDPLRLVGNPIPVAGADGPLPGGFKTFTVGTDSWTAKHYTININQFQDTLYSNVLGPTTLWGFHPANSALPQKHLGGIIVANKGEPIQITFNNNLLAGNGTPLPNIIPVDTSIPGATQAQNRTAVHVHGGFVQWISDGGPHDWWAPTSPTAGTSGLSFKNNTVLNPNALPNQAEYYYPNTQSARLVWYHDHAWGITRINAYAGIASAYVITDDYETLLTSAPVNLPGPLDPRTHYLVFQDKIFVDAATIGTVDPSWPGLKTTGTLWYAHQYDTLRWLLGPTPGGLPPDPSVIPEFFGDTILVNGAVYPYLQVEPRQYRFRLLNACNARFLNPRLVYANSNVVNSVASTEPSNTLGPGFTQIGSEGGFLPAPVVLTGKNKSQLLLGPAERADIIVDFSKVPAGSILILYADAPAPFPKGDARNDYYPGNPKTPTSVAGFGPNTRTLMQFRVVGNAVTPNITLPATFTPTDPFLVTQTLGVPIAPLVTAGFASITLSAAYGGGTVTVPYKYKTLNEAFDERGRLIQYIGTDVATGLGGPGMFGRVYMDTPTETPAAGGIEIWEIVNLTGDTHPIHFHLVNVQILSRQPFNPKKYIGGAPTYNGAAIAPDANEMGWKETVRMNPGEVTRVIAKYDLPAVPFTVPASDRTGGNEYVWHCHILEHEEHDMMRPVVVSGTCPTFKVTPAEQTAATSALPTKDPAVVKTYTIVDTIPTPPTPTYTVTPNTFGAAITGNTLTVTVPAGTSAQDVVYTIKDNRIPMDSAIAVLHVT